MYQYTSKDKTQSDKSKTSITNKSGVRTEIKIPVQTKSLSSLSFNQEHREEQECPVPNSSRPNHTGIPMPMKSHFEALSSFLFDDVKVHYNSDKPAQLQALAYTQGNQVYIGPGQEKHLVHELGHVVQQKQGAVNNTGYINGIPVNTDRHLEKDADLIFAKPLSANTSKKRQGIIQGRFLDMHDLEMAPDAGGKICYHFIQMTKNLIKSVLNPENFLDTSGDQHALSEFEILEVIFECQVEVENYLKKGLDKDIPIFTAIDVLYEKIHHILKAKRCTLADGYENPVNPKIVSAIKSYIPEKAEIGGASPILPNDKKIDILVELRLGNSSTLEKKGFGSGGQRDPTAVEQWSKSDMFTREKSIELIKKSAITYNDLDELLLSINKTLRGTESSLREHEISYEVALGAEPRKILPLLYATLSNIATSLNQLKELPLGEKQARAVSLAAYANKMLISIHPFSDGNGRTCRLFADFILFFASLPPAMVPNRNFIDLHDGESPGVAPTPFIVSQYAKNIAQSNELLLMHSG